MRVIDLSGAWRLEDAAHRAVYKCTMPILCWARVAVGSRLWMPGMHREKIAEARLVANPGCYATSIILALAPLLRAGLVDLDHGIVCDAKSGVSGAGKAATAKTHFMYAADNLSAYAVFGHRHTGEMLEQLGPDVRPAAVHAASAADTAWHSVDDLCAAGGACRAGAD